MSTLLDFLQSASNTVAQNVTGPVDLITLALRKAGVPVPEDAVGTSKWAADRGLMRDVPMGPTRLAGETFGLVGPMMAAAKAPQIAAGLLKAQENAAAPVAAGQASGQRGAIVWHGSPHKFDRFDSSKIGTGEGAQAYGHGLYLAESPDVAKQYQATLGKTMIEGAEVPDEPIYRAAAYAYDVGGGTIDGALKYAKSQNWNKDGIEAIKALSNATFHKGALYKIDLPDSAIARMLDWDKPLSQQPGMLESARAAMHKGPQEALRMDVWARDNPSATGGDLIKQLERLYGVRYANKALSGAGIPGIRYLDGSSRAAGEGTRNFVVFPGEEGLLKILERNGIPLE